MPPRRRLETNAATRVSPVAFLRARVGTNCVGVVVSTGRRARSVCPSNARSSEVCPRFKKQQSRKGRCGRTCVTTRAHVAFCVDSAPKCPAVPAVYLAVPVRRLSHPRDTYRDPMDTTTPTTATTTHPFTSPIPRARHATPGIIAHRPRAYPGALASYHSRCRLAASARFPNTAASIARFTHTPSFPTTAHRPAYSKTSAA